jgi:hypothetical protein
MPLIPYLPADADVVQSARVQGVLKIIKSRLNGPVHGLLQRLALVYQIVLHGLPSLIFSFAVNVRDGFSWLPHCERTKFFSCILADSVTNAWEIQQIEVEVYNLTALFVFDPLLWRHALHNATFKFSYRGHRRC